MKDKLKEIWLWVLAVAFSIVMACTAMAWVMGLAICLMRLIND